MSIPTFSPLGASTTNRKWALDVEDPDAPGVYVGVRGIQESKPRPSDATTQDDSDMDGEGYGSQAVTGLRWGFDGKLLRKLRQGVSTEYDRGQEILRKVARRVGGVVKFRYYEMEPDGPRVEAYEGYGTVTWVPDGGNMESLDSVAFTISGRGKPTEIEHPEAVAAVPLIQSVLPSGAAEGDQVVIQGFYFTDVSGVAGVKFGGTNATAYEVLSDSTILATLPAGAAGSAPVKVGAGAETPYTRA